MNQKGTGRDVFSGTKDDPYVENCSLKEVQGCFKCFEGLCIIHKEPKKMAFYKQVSHKVINSFL